MKQIILAALAALLIPCAAWGAEESEPPAYQRTDSLEIPGLTAGCHICEWRPRPNQRPAAEQCGLDDDGKPKVGLFECGFSEDCERVCHFIRCGTL